MSLDGEISTIIAGIVSTIAGVADAGNVLDHQPYTINADEFMAAYGTTIGGATVVRAWVVTLASTVVRQADFQDFDVPVSFRVYGYLGVNDAALSEPAMRSLALAVFMALCQESTFGSSAVLAVEEAEMVGPELAIVPREGGVLCHRVTITLPMLLDQQIVWT